MTAQSTGSRRARGKSALRLRCRTLVVPLAARAAPRLAALLALLHALHGPPARADFEGSARLSASDGSTPTPAATSSRRAPEDAIASALLAGARRCLRRALSVQGRYDWACASPAPDDEDALVQAAGAELGGPWGATWAGAAVQAKDRRGDAPTPTCWEAVSWRWRQTPSGKDGWRRARTFIFWPAFGYSFGAPELAASSLRCTGATRARLGGGGPARLQRPALGVPDATPPRSWASAATPPSPRAPRTHTGPPPSPPATASSPRSPTASASPSGARISLSGAVGCRGSSSSRDFAFRSPLPGQRLPLPALHPPAGRQGFNQLFVRLSPPLTERLDVELS